MSEESSAAWRQTNLARWDERVPIHAASGNYDLETFRKGQDVIPSFEAEEVGDVSGMTLAHLQCHMGQDTLSWARRGAKRVVGLDFSPAAIGMARSLAEDLGYADRADFVVSDLYDAAEALPEDEYDVVYVSCGAIDWLPDIGRWARTAASLVRPGGFLYVSEFHPIHFSFKDTAEVVERGYFLDGPIEVDEPGTYTTPEAQTVHNRGYQWVHTLGEVVSAIAATGLRIEFLHEHDKNVFRRFVNLERGEDGFFRFPGDRPNLPMMYTLKATREG